MHRKNNITLTHTDTGVKLAHLHSPGAPVEYCGIVIHAGSRNDPDSLHGLAHFVEHTIFKGTEKRSSWHIINRMERVGGELNAYTTKEETVIYTAAPAGNMKRAFELIADLVINSRFPDAEIDKEREVVADEINSYLDVPADAVFDDFEDIIFAGTPIGHNILGSEKAIADITSASCREYLRQWYVKSNVAVFYYGSSTIDRVTGTVSDCFGNLSAHDCQHVHLPENFRGATFDRMVNIDAHQAHTVLGALAPDIYDDRHYAMALLTNILGGPGMNSRLNVILREKRGLVYSVEASTGLMSDCGLFTVYFGCDPADTDRCCELIRNEIASMGDTLMSDTALRAAKKQYLGQLAVASDNHENMAISLGRNALFFNKIHTTDETIGIIETITSTQIAEAAQNINILSRLTLT